jgi:hypothetical protein
MFNRITGTEQIKRTMREYMLEPEKRRADFLATIRVRGNEERPGGWIFEGARPIASATSTADKIGVLEIDEDSNYTAPIASVYLSQIEYVEVLP